MNQTFSNCRIIELPNCQIVKLISSRISKYLKKNKIRNMKKVFLLLTMLGMALLAKAQTDLIISEYVEGWSTNKALELYNPTNTPISMASYRVTRYSNGQDVPPADIGWTFRLPNRVIPPFRSYVIVGDKRDPAGTGQEAPVWAQLGQRADTFACPIYTESKTMYFNGNDAVALEKQVGAEWLVVDLFGRWGAPAPALAAIPGSSTSIEAWTDVSPYFSGVGVALTADHTLIRKSSVKNGITVNPALFNTLAEYDSLPANTFKNLGWHKYDGAPANNTPVLNISQSVFFVSPSAVNGTVLGILNASDTESDAMRFYIDYGNFVYKPSGSPLIPDKRIEPFGLNRSTGELMVANNLGLLPALKSVFYLETTVNDGFSQSEPVDITVIITEPITAINISSAGGVTAIDAHQGTLQFTAEVLPVVSYDPALQYMWKVSDENIATIDPSGIVSALKNGTVDVLCLALDGSGVEGSFELTITGQPLPVTALNISSAGGLTAIDTDNGTLQFTVEVVPSFVVNPDTRYMWKISDETVASIDASGLVTAIANGIANIICTAMDGSGVESSFELTISGQTVSVSAMKSNPVTLYPNPVEGNQFRIAASKEIQTIIITDVASREVYRKSFNKPIQSSDIELGSNFKGVFIVSVIFNDNSRGVSKLVVR
jgi:uncharacterized protein YjdB